MLIERQLLLVRVGVGNADEHGRLQRYCCAFKATILARGPEEIVIELTGQPGRLDCFENILGGLDVRECVRSEPQWVNLAKFAAPA